MACMHREISLNVKEFRKIIREYYTKPRPDPFLDWFKEQEKAGVFQSLFEKVLIVIVDARFDQATKAENALENTKRVFEAGLIRKEPAKLNEVPDLIPVADTTSKKWAENFFLAHRMMIKYAEDIIEGRRWTAEELVKKIQKVPYLGPKTSRLCVRWLHELIGDLEIDMSSYKVPIDRLLYRVACRLGIVNPYKEKYWVGYEGGPADEKIQNFAREAFPENPGLIDEPMWSEGRMPQDGGHCYPKNPIHYGCLFESVCPKKYDDVDPSRIGLVTYRSQRFS